MIRKANINDLDLIENSYNEHFQHEIEHGAFTMFKKGVYPTRESAEKAISSGDLYIYEENGDLAGSIIVNKIQPQEYRNIKWLLDAPDEEVMLIHLLMVRPAFAGKGIGRALVNYITDMAAKGFCKSVRLDTGQQNIPALALYKKLGFQIAASSPMNIGGAIEHKEHLFLEKVL